MEDFTQYKLEKKPTKGYVDEKIFRLDNLIAETKDPQRKEAYSNYRDFWISQLTKRQNPDTIAEKKAIKEARAIEKAEIQKRDEEREETLRAMEEQRAAEKEAKLQDTLKQIKELEALLPKKELIEEPEEVKETAPEESIND